MTLRTRTLLCSVLLGAAFALAGAGHAAAEGEAEDIRQPDVQVIRKVEEDPKAQRKKAVDAHLLAGIESLKARDPERARKHINRALELDDDSAEAHNAMALLYRYEGDEKREEAHFRKALRIDGDFSQARNNYAGFLYRKGRYKEAIKQLERATNDTNYEQRALAFLNLGRCYAKTGELDKALEALERSLRLDRMQADAPIELADVLLTQQHYADAAAQLQVFEARARNTPRSLWIGIRVAAALGHADKVSSYEFQLAKMFRDSPEYREWQKWKAGSGATDHKTK